MKSLLVIGRNKDLRTGADVFYATIEMREYLELVGQDFDRFEIQRPRQKYKAYERMKADIIKGALLPTITLAINPKFISEFSELSMEKGTEVFLKALNDPKKLYILDGLQRTYIINDIINEGHDLKNQKLMLEFWIERDLKHLIYRLIVLNAGQKPMSMRHQVELLFVTMQGKLEDDIPGLTLMTERDESRRTRPGHFPFERIVTGYYAYITKTPEIRKENIVVQGLVEETVMESSEDNLNTLFVQFESYLKTYLELDKATYQIYNAFNDPEIKAPYNWFAEENVIASFFSAISQFSLDEKRESRVAAALLKLTNILKNAERGTDPLEFTTLSRVRSGINPKKYNVGTETRRILNNGFKEFFREEGELSIGECWKLGAN